MVRWGLIFGFCISTKWLSYRNIFFLPTAEICHHGNLDLEGRGALGKYVATTSEIVIQIGFRFSSLFSIYEVLAHWAAARITRSEGGHAALNSCFLPLEGAVFGAISSLTQLAPSFPSCSSKPAQLSGSCRNTLRSGACSVTRCCWGNTEILNWGPSSSALGSMLFIYWLQYTHSYFVVFDIRVREWLGALNRLGFLVGFFFFFFCIFEGKKPDTNVH